MFSKCIQTFCLHSKFKHGKNSSDAIQFYSVPARWMTAKSAYEKGSWVEKDRNISSKFSRELMKIFSRLNDGCIQGGRIFRPE